MLLVSFSGFAKVFRYHAPAVVSIRLTEPIAGFINLYAIVVDTKSAHTLDKYHPAIPLPALYQLPVCGLMATAIQVQKLRVRQKYWLQYPPDNRQRAT